MVCSRGPSELVWLGCGLHAPGARRQHGCMVCARYALGALSLLAPDIAQGHNRRELRAAALCGVLH
eukprot:9592988-Alexandrium_andersonii.AAC.1